MSSHTIIWAICEENINRCLFFVLFWNLIQEHSHARKKLNFYCALLQNIKYWTLHLSGIHISSFLEARAQNYKSNLYTWPQTESSMNHTNIVTLTTSLCDLARGKRASMFVESCSQYLKNWWQGNQKLQKCSRFSFHLPLFCVSQKSRLVLTSFFSSVIFYFWN